MKGAWSEVDNKLEDMLDVSGSVCVAVALKPGKPSHPS